MVDIATLAIQVKTEGVQQANAEIDNLAKNSGKAESATKKMGSSFDSVARYIQSAVKVMQEMSGSVSGLASTVAANTKAIERHFSSMAQDAGKSVHNMVAKAEAEINRLNVAGKGVTDRLSGHFESLGIRSSVAIEKERLIAASAYNSIRTSGVSSADEITRAQKALQLKMSELNAELVGKTVPATNRWRDSLNSVRGSISGFMAALAAMGLAAFIKSCIDTQLQVERLGRLLNAAAGNANLGGREMEYAREMTKKFGLDLVTTTESYGKFMAAIRGTTLEGEKGRRVFEAVSGASTALGLRAEETSGIFNALQQMMSKGKVQAEELRGQLGERLPGAFKMAADAMGISTAELDKNLAAGTVMADDLLPKLAAELDKTYGKAAVEGARSAQAEINRFNNALFESKAAVGSALMPAMSDILSSLMPVIEMVGLAIKAFQQLAVSYAVTMGKISAAQEVGWFGLMTKSGRAQYKQGAANAETAGYEQYQEIEKRYSRPASTGYTATELLRQSQNKAVTPAGKSGEADKAAREAEQWRKTYADLRKEVDALVPGLDEYAKKVGEVSNKYDDLMHKKGADIILLQQLRAEHLKAIEVQKQVDDTSKEFKTIADAEQEAANLAQAQQEIEDWNRSIRDMVAALDPAIAKDKQFSDGIYDINRAFGEDGAAAIDAYTNAFFKLKEVQSENADLGISVIADPYEQQRATMVKFYDDEQKKIEENLKILKDAGKERTEIYKALTEKQTKLITKQAQDSQKISDEETKAKLSMVSNYASIAGGLFMALADTQDQSSRKGFETAKAFNIAAAVMSTAAAVMNALATVQPYPLAIVAAASAAATGVIQIAKIASTTFGGGAGSVGTVSAGFSGGGGNTAGGGSVGGSIGAPTLSIHDDITEAALQSLATSTENASLAIDKVANGMTSIADLFSSGQAGLLSGSITTAGYSEPASNFAKQNTAILNISQSLKHPLSIESIFDTLTTALGLGTLFGFGNDFQTTATGLRLSGTGSALNVRSYQKQEKDGGWFGSDETRFLYNDVSQGLSDTLQGYLQSVENTIARAAAAMGTTTEMGGVVLPVKKIQTSGVSSEKIQEKLQAWFEDVADQLAQTTSGLKEFTYYGESAFDALVRLASALQSANETMELIGANLIDSTLAGANAAYQIQELMGGSEDFTDKVTTYFESMFSDELQAAMKAAQSQRQLTVAFSEMNAAVDGLAWSVPTTREGFVALVNSLDVTTDNGRALFAALMDIAPAFDLIAQAADDALAFQQSIVSRYARANGNEQIADYYDAVIEAEAELKAARDAGYDTTMLEVVQRQELTALLKDGYLSAADNYLDAMNDTVTQLESSAKALRATAEALRSAKYSLMTGSNSVLSPEDQFKAARAEFYRVYQSGDYSQLGSQAQSYLSVARNVYASDSTYSAEYANVMSILDQTTAATESQAAKAEQDAAEQRQLLKDMNAQLGAQVEEQKKTNAELAAQVRVMQEAFSQLITLTADSGTSLEELERLARQAAA